MEKVNAKNGEFGIVKGANPQFGFCLSIDEKMHRLFFHEKEETRDKWFEHLKKYTVVVKTKEFYQNLKMVYNFEPDFSVKLFASFLMRNIWRFRSSVTF